MSRCEQKVVQYLNEAHASELALVRVLQSQIAMTPRGSYRAALETHLGETRRHAERVQTRLGELSGGGNPLLRARSQGACGRAQGDRARAHQRLKRQLLGRAQGRRR